MVEYLADAGKALVSHGWLLQFVQCYGEKIQALLCAKRAICAVANGAARSKRRIIMIRRASVLPRFAP